MIIIQFISEGNKFYYTDLVSDSFMDKTIKNNLENKSSSFGVININNENLKNRFLKIFNYKYDAEAYTTENNNTKTLLNSFVPPSFNPIQKSFGKPYATIQVQREEQSYFKKLYFGSNKQIKCYICKNEFNREFVWLSHLKKEVIVQMKNVMIITFLCQCVYLVVTNYMKKVTLLIKWNYWNLIK